MLQQYKPFFIFLLKFFGVYALLSSIYWGYLREFDPKNYDVDGFTWLVSKQTLWLTEAFGYACKIAPHPFQSSIKFVIEGNFVARIVEGCNGISVMILFAAFVVAFKGKWKTMLWFIPLGILLIHILNILRISLLAISLLRYPQYEHILHGVLFPAAIYGTVFLLWVVWVNKFSTYGGNKN